MSFIYSSHRSANAAWKALDDYIANGEVSSPEVDTIRKRWTGVRYVWDILLKDF